VAAKSAARSWKARGRGRGQVAPGDRLAVVDHAALDISSARPRPASGCESQLALLVKGARSEDIRQAEAALRQTEATLKVAEDDARRMRELFRTGSVTSKQTDDAEAAPDRRDGPAQRRRRALGKVRKLRPSRRGPGRRGPLDQARAAADLLAKSIADCTITAPAAGVVTTRSWRRANSSPRARPS